MQKPKNIKPAEMSAEQKKEMAARAYVQKRNSIAEGIIFNAVHACALAEDLIDTAIKLADYYMEKAFGVKADPVTPEAAE